MPTKKITKSDTKTSEVSGKKMETKSLSKSDTKKVVVKRRKTELKPTKASAVAIASQANRAKKQALIEKLESGNVPSKRVKTYKDNTKIPTWVWIFFGCSLMLFCVSFYQAVFRPSIESDVMPSDIQSEIYAGESDNSEVNNENLDNSEIGEESNVTESSESNTEFLDYTPTTVTDGIQLYFSYLSNRQFEDASNLLIPALRNSSEMKEHFTSFRMNPFLDGIEGGKLVPTNFQYVSTSAFGRDKYSFDLSYVLNSDKTRYDEIWEAVVDTKGDSPKITSLICITAKCSYHPIFWPENFGLLR